MWMASSGRKLGRSFSSKMDTAIIVALITGVCAILGQAIISKASTRDLYAKLDKQSEVNDQKLDAKLEKYQAVTDTKIQTLTDEVRRHNAFAERIPVLENRITNLESK